MRIPAVLREYGIKVRVQLLTWDDPDEGLVYRSLTEQGFEVSSQRFKDTHSNIRSLLRWVAKSTPDIFIANHVIPAFFAGKWIRAAGVPTIGILHSDDEFYKAIQEEFVFGDLTSAVSAAVCVSEELMHQVSRRRPSNTMPVRVPYGVPIPGRSAHRLPERLRIGFVGRLVEEQKRISEVTRSLSRVVRELDGVEATNYGDGPDVENVKKILAAEKNSDRVKLAGAVPSEQIQDRLLEECDTIVLLSDYEGLPIAILEAMACGIVPICLNIRSGIPELIQQGVTGLLVSDREESFTNAVRLLRDRSDLWKSMSSSARELVRTKNSLHMAAGLWTDLFRKLTENSDGRRTVGLPRRLALPAINPALADEDRRIDAPVLGEQVNRCWNSIRRFVRFPS
jgi:glycosyltransferase involved in cell wall biosynthesis